MQDCPAKWDNDLPVPEPIHITDPSDPRVREYASLKEGDLQRGIDERSPHGAFIGEGALIAEHLLESGYPCRSLLIAAGHEGAFQRLIARVPAEVPVYLASNEVLHALVGFKFHRGLLAAGSRRPRPGCEEALDLIATAPALVVLEDLTNLDNLGGIFRCASALAPEGTVVVLSPRCCDPLYRKAIRVSMGHSLRIPFVVLEDWAAAPSQIRRAGFELVALTPRADAEPLRAAAAPARERRVAIALGSEGPGLSDQLMSAADRCVRIEQRAGVDSLNVMVAGAIAMSALFRL